MEKRGINLAQHPRKENTVISRPVPSRRGSIPRRLGALAVVAVLVPATLLEPRSSTLAAPASATKITITASAPSGQVVGTAIDLDGGRARAENPRVPIQRGGGERSSEHRS